MVVRLKYGMRVAIIGMLSEWIYLGPAPNKPGWVVIQVTDLSDAHLASLAAINCDTLEIARRDIEPVSTDQKEALL